MQNAWGQTFLLSTAVFATLLTPFSVTLNNHTIAAAGAMFTLSALWKIISWPSADRNAPESVVSQPSASTQGANASRWERNSPHPVWFAICGFFAGWTCAHELPAALLGVATFFLACRQSLVKTLVAYVPAALIPLAFFFVTNWIASGTIKPAYADYGTEKYRFVVDGVPSYWMEPKGIDRNVDSTPVYLFHCLIGHHGIFSLTPIWLLLIPAWFASMKAPRSFAPSAHLPAALRQLSWLSLVLTLVVLGFYFSRTENYNYGGNTSGLRWALWLVPFWLVTLIPIVDAWSEAKAFRLAVVPLFLVSAYSAWSRVENPWRQPWIFEWMEARGWIDFSEPRPPLAHPLWTWIAAVPDVSDGRPRWMEFVNASAAYGGCRMRLEAVPSRDNTNHVLLTATRRCDQGEPQTICRVEIDRTAFLHGSSPSEFLRWPDAGVSEDRRRAESSFLSGLPVLQTFRPGVIRYRKTPLRRDAFRCQHALAQARLDQERRQYRCDIWLCEELPFGLAEVEFQVFDAATGLLLRQERWQAAASEPPPPPQAQWSPAP
jgi:hypothetical protein